jgi:small conductance mechanosensitive channel
MEELNKVLPAAAVDFGGRLFGAALILFVGWIVVRYFTPPLNRALQRSRLDPSFASFLTNSARAAFVVMLIVAAMQQLGLQTASVLTLLGTVGLAVALSLQGSLANFASGLLVLSFRMVRVGDLIEVGDVRGQVIDLLPFHVVVVTVDNQRVTVPNTSLTSSAVRNHSALPNRRAQWLLPLLPADDLATVKETLVARLRGDARVLAEPAPQAFLQEWTDSKRVLAVQAWTLSADQPRVQQEMLETLATALEGIRRSSAGESRPG